MTLPLKGRRPHPRCTNYLECWRVGGPSAVACNFRELQSRASDRRRSQGNAVRHLGQCAVEVLATVAKTLVEIWAMINFCTYGTA